jgi:hypothetical protein
MPLMVVRFRLALKQGMAICGGHEIMIGKMSLSACANYHFGYTLFRNLTVLFL